MTAEEFWQLYCKKWNSRSTLRSMRGYEGTWKKWTDAMTRLLHDIGRSSGSDYVVVDKSITKPEQQEWYLGNRKEYLTLDGMWLPQAFGRGQRGQWCLPEVVLEHQSYEPKADGGAVERIALCLWKLLCTRAALRVLIAYVPDDEVKGAKAQLNTEVMSLLEDDAGHQVLIIIESTAPMKSAKNPDAWWVERKEGGEPITHDLEWLS